MESQGEFTTIVRHASKEYERLEVMMEEVIELKTQIDSLKREQEKE